MSGTANVLDGAPASTAQTAAPAAVPTTRPAFDAVLLLQNMAGGELLDAASLEAGDTGDLLGGSDADEEEDGDELEASLAFLSALITATTPRQAAGDLAAGADGQGADPDASPGMLGEVAEFMLKTDANSEKTDLLNLRLESFETRAGGDAAQNLARAAELLLQANRPAAPVSQTVLTHARDPRWADDFNTRVSLLVRGGESTASLSMTPMDLGPVEVNVTVRDSQATILFSASQAETRALIEASLPRLRELLAAQGFNLSDASVSSGFSRSQQQASAHASRGGGEGDPGVGEVQASRQLGLLDLYV